jgi:hypothetical protein
MRLLPKQTMVMVKQASKMNSGKEKKYPKDIIIDCQKDAEASKMNSCIVKNYPNYPI